MTARDIIIQAQRKLGVETVQKTPTAKEISDGLEALNSMISSWSADRLLIHANTLSSLSITNAKATYTYGSGGDLGSTRPIGRFAIKNAYIRDSNNNDYNLAINTRAEYLDEPSKIILKARPTELIYDPQYTLAQITFNPWPDANYTAFVDAIVPLTEFALSTTSLSMPPEYKRALIYNLAIELAPEYGISVPKEVGFIAGDSLRKIKNVNTPTMLRRADEGALGHSDGFGNSKRSIEGGY